MAIPKPTGMAISIAMNEVTSVPYIGPSAPSTGGSADGAQRDVHRNARPYCWIAGQAPTIREMMMPPRINRTETAQARVIQ
jgi:hypothetical protein